MSRKNNPTKPISQINGKSAKDYIMLMIDEAHLDLLFAFVLLYAFVSMGYTSYVRSHPNVIMTMTLSRLFDFVMLIVLIAFVLYYYWTCDRYTKDHMLDVMMKWVYTFYTNPVMMFSTIIFVGVFTAIIFAMNIPMHDASTPLSVTVIAHKGWYLLYSQVIYNILKYVFGLDLIRYLEDPKSYYGDVGDEGTPTPGPTSMKCNTPTTGRGTTPTPTTTTKTTNPSNSIDESNVNNEVYQVAEDLYTYGEAAEICKVLDSRLATYEDIELAYKNGAEWCGYGWSENQMAFFPTQSATWDKMQKHPETKNLCGRPGINGGFMSDPKLKFGVNCYGVKPDERMRSKCTEPDTPEYLALFGGGKIASDASKLKDTLQIKPFRPDFWSYKAKQQVNTSRPTPTP